MALPMFFTGVLELWSNGEDPVSDGRKRDIKSCLAGDQKNSIFLKSLQIPEPLVLFLFNTPVLQYSNTPTKA
jgi:hypothetical protein